ncbi:hypothetical protein C0Q70_02050 [Pomacea canaliculata]|uniref:Uncharacterized protein n=1 Tax=Pomacea canaliculata TaxID=400727 RepID=A0A2T7Q1A3_POMCA|nr:hypothetical protein C0Q70_02050 [Pomacea canaliculata]
MADGRAIPRTDDATPRARRHVTPSLPHSEHGPHKSASDRSFVIDAGRYRRQPHAAGPSRRLLDDQT